MFKNYNKDRCYIIAEIGGNFTKLDQAKKLIDEAKKCGVDAIKLQTYKADTLSSKKAMFDFENTGNIPQYDLFKKYEISEKLHKEVFEYASSKNLDWFSTPSHQSDVDMLEKLGVGAYKIGSDDAYNIPFLKYVARTGKPIILATGMCTMQEVWESVYAILEEGNDHLFLLHAVSSYPAYPASINLQAIKSMIEEFPCIPVGYSDHTLGTTAIICAVAMGSKMVEKHFTYDKNAEGPDHMHSACPEEMKEIVDRIREFEIMRGNGIKRPAVSEKTSRINTRKSIVIGKDIKAGEKITKDHIVIKRPGYGIPPKYIEQVIGRMVSKNLAKEDVLKWEDF
jgi:N-acetylneuraminate synthase